MALCPAWVGAQGIVTFANHNASLVFDSVTLSSVPASAGLRAALYYAPDGETNFANFIQLGASATVGTPIAGFFAGGNRTTPESTPPGGFGMFQIRVWEVAYGQSFETAVVAPPMNGRPAIAGISQILHVRTGNGSNISPAVLPLNGLTSIPVAVGFFSPAININDVVVSEGTNGTVIARFLVTLDTASSQIVSVDFTTADGTAQAGQDYVGTNGTVTFLPGEVSQEIAITVTADVPVEADEIFHLNLSNAANAFLLRSQATCTITEIRVTGVRVDTSVSFNTVAGRHYLLEYSQDFATWTTVTGASNVLGTGGIIMVVDQGSGCDAGRYYRARLME